MEIITALSAVMEHVGGIAKREKNTHQGFNFRGIDSVVNAVSPALRANGVIVVPCVLESHYDTVTVGRNQTVQGHARVVVQYTFWAKDGSNVSATVSAESMDSGDKATAKAMSVAFRTALLQALCLPTDEKDPDADSYERSPLPTKTAPSRPQEKADIPYDPDGPVPFPKEVKKPVGLTPMQIKFVNQKCAEIKVDPVEYVSSVVGRKLESVRDVAPDEVTKVLGALGGAK